MFPFQSPSQSCPSTHPPIHTLGSSPSRLVPAVSRHILLEQGHELEGRIHRVSIKGSHKCHMGQACYSNLCNGGEEVLVPERERLLATKVKVLGVVVDQLGLWSAGGGSTGLSDAIKRDKTLS